MILQVQEGANGAHGDDIKRVKEELVTWINQDYQPKEILNPKTQSGQGLLHDVCGGLLVPIDFDWEDPQ